MVYIKLLYIILLLYYTIISYYILYIYYYILYIHILLLYILYLILYSSVLFFYLPFLLFPSLFQYSSSPPHSHLSSISLPPLFFSSPFPTLVHPDLSVNSKYTCRHLDILIYIPQESDPACFIGVDGWGVWSLSVSVYVLSWWKLIGVLSWCDVFDVRCILLYIYYYYYYILSYTILSSSSVLLSSSFFPSPSFYKRNTSVYV